MKLKILSYNIHKGFNLTKTKVTLEKLKSLLSEMDIDLIFLQELVGENLRHAKRYRNKGWPEETHLEYLAHTLWPHSIYVRNAVNSQGHHGNAILSKYPIKLWRNRNISTYNVEKRGLLECQIQIPGHAKPLYAFCSHLNLAWGRSKQHQMIHKRLQSLIKKNHPLILAGDFNDWDLSAKKTLEYQTGLKEAFKEFYGDYAKTFPDFLPTLPLDRVYFNNLKAVHAEVMTSKAWKKISDHTALYCHFEI